MNKLIQWGHLVLTVILFIGCILILNKTKKIGYVVTSELFSNFKMTRDIETDMKKIEMAKKATLDSITINWNKVSNKNESNYLDIQKQFLYKKQQFSEELSNLKQNNIDKINKQINQYCIDYAKENGYDIILGANGQGSLMYANDVDNQTEKMIEYVNKKYEGNY